MLNFTFLCFFLHSVILNKYPNMPENVPGIQTSTEWQYLKTKNKIILKLYLSLGTLGDGFPGADAVADQASAVLANWCCGITGGCRRHWPWSCCPFTLFTINLWLMVNNNKTLLLVVFTFVLEEFDCT